MLILGGVNLSIVTVGECLEHHIRLPLRTDDWIQRDKLEDDGQRDRFRESPRPELIR